MDNNDINYDLVEDIIEHGEMVFARDWDSCGPGAGAGCDYVYCWNGQYALLSEGYGSSGPYSKLEDALNEYDLLMVTPATQSVWCERWTARQLANRLHCEVEDGHELSLNNKGYVYESEKGKFLCKPKSNRETKNPAKTRKRH